MSAAVQALNGAAVGNGHSSVVAVDDAHLPAEPDPDTIKMFVGQVLSFSFLTRAYPMPPLSRSPAVGAKSSVDSCSSSLDPCTSSTF